MPIYYYKNTKTGEEFEHILLKVPKDPWEDLILKDGTRCERIWAIKNKKSYKRRRLTRKNMEIFESDPDYVRKLATPGYTKIKFQDGHRELYDPSKHN